MTKNLDRGFLTQTLADLITIDSSNPMLTQGGAGEKLIGDYIENALLAIGLYTKRYEPRPGRLSVLGILPGIGGGRSLMLNAHADTVGAGGMRDPFTPRLHEGKMYGRGAQDMKGSLAACLTAAKALAESRNPLAGDLLIAAVADEEYASLGTSDMIEQLRAENRLPDMALVTEPTGLQIAAAHRGFTWLEVETIGRAAHGSRWWEGIDANRHMGRVLNGLDLLANELIARPPHRLVGPPSLHTPVIQGGREVSIYADRCTLQIERRTIPGETDEQVASEIQGVLDRLAAADTQFQARLALKFSRNAFEARTDSNIVGELEKAFKEIMGKPAAVTGVAFWTDAALLADAGVDTALIGPVGGGLHSDEEWVEMESCAKLAEILVKTAERVCR